MLYALLFLLHQSKSVDESSTLGSPGSSPSSQVYMLRLNEIVSLNAESKGDEMASVGE